MKKTRKQIREASIPAERKLEQRLDFLLHTTGHLFPVTPEQVEAFEKLGIKHPLPDACNDIDAIFKRVKKS